MAAYLPGSYHSYTKKRKFIIILNGNDFKQNQMGMKYLWLK